MGEEGIQLYLLGAATRNFWTQLCNFGLYLWVSFGLHVGSFTLGCVKSGLSRGAADPRYGLGPLNVGPRSLLGY